MQAPAPKKPIIFKQAKVVGPRDDQVTIPLIHNKWISTPDTTWVTPAIMFHKKVLGDGIIDEDTFIKRLEGLVRDSTTSELKLLKKHAFLGINHSSALMMVKVDGLAKVLEGVKANGISAIVASLSELPPIEGTTNTGSDATFPSHIPPCTLGGEEMKGEYSLSTCAPHFLDNGTEWHKQLEALKKAKQGGSLIGLQP